MSEFIVHSIPGSPFGRSVLATLEEKRAPYRLAPVAPGATKTPEYLALHPFGRVPVLEHDGFRLYETQAILRYLDRVLPQPSLTPADVKRAARMDQAMNINDWYLFHGVGNVIIFHRMIAPQLHGAGAGRGGDQGGDAEGARGVRRTRKAARRPALFRGRSALARRPACWRRRSSSSRMTPEWSVLGAPHANLVAWIEAHAGAAEHDGDHLGAGHGAREGGVRSRPNFMRQAGIQQWLSRTASGPSIRSGGLMGSATRFG